MKPVPPERVETAILRGIERSRPHLASDRQTAVLAALFDLPKPAVAAPHPRLTDFFGQNVDLSCTFCPKNAAPGAWT